VIAKDNPLVSDWETETPKDIRAGAIQDLVAGYKACISNLKNGNISHFKLGFRKKKNSYSIRIPSSAITKNKKLYIYKTYIKNGIKISKDKCLKNISIDHDCRLKNDNGKWYIYIPVKVKSEQIEPDDEICSLDPGVVNFQTIFSNERTIKIETRKENLKKIQNKLDELQSLRDKKLIKHRHYKRKTRKIYSNIKNCIDDMQFKTIKYLCSQYKTIIIPTFESQDIVVKMKSRKNKRDILSLNHYKFKERLKSHITNKKYNKVIVVTEEYTSKTCSSCGKINNVGLSRTLKCQNCNLIIDRDINGSRGIMIKTIKEYTT